MADHDDGAGLGDVHQGLLEFGFRMTVEARRRFVQQHHRRIAHQGAGDGDALTLATRQARARFADFGSVTIRQVDDEVVHAGLGCGLDDFFVGGVGLARSDVVAHGAGKQHAFLRHVAQPVGQLRTRELGHVGAVQQYAAFLRLIEALNDFQQRGLARTVASHQRVNAAGFDFQGNAGHHRSSAFGIGEHHVFNG